MYNEKRLGLFEFFELFKFSAKWISSAAARAPLTYVLLLVSTNLAAESVFQNMRLVRHLTYEKSGKIQNY